MSHIAECIGIGASYYNLALAVVVLILYIKLILMPSGKVFIKPWRFIFASFCIYIGEEVLTVLEGAGVISPPAVLFPIIEFLIIVVFLYAFLTMREHIKGAQKK